MPKRKTLSRGLRFDVFHRDQFRCRYCGATPNQTLLTVDHVIAVARGGTDKIDNLVTSCSACNSGKSAKLLGAVPQGGPSAEEMMERVDQIKAYAKSFFELQAAEDAIANQLVGEWELRIGPLRGDTIVVLRRRASDTSLEEIAHAIDATAKRFWSEVPTDYPVTKHARYFSGVLRKMREARQNEQEEVL